MPLWTKCVNFHMKLLYRNGEKIDSRSQDILVYLFDESRDKGHIAPDIARTLGLNNAELVRYRIRRYLEPAQLVHQIGRKPQKGSRKDSPLFALTPDGREWVQNRINELERPNTLEDIRGVAHEAQAMAESAQGSARTNQKNISRNKGRIEDLEEQDVLDIYTVRQVVGIETRELCQTIDEHDALLDGAYGDVINLEHELNELKERLDTLAEYVDVTGHRAQHNEGEIEKARAAHNNLFDEVDELRSQLSEIEIAIESRKNRHLIWSKP